MASMGAATESAAAGSKAIVAAGSAIWAVLVGFSPTIAGEWDKITQLGATGVVLVLLVWVVVIYLPAVTKSHGEEIAAMRTSFEETITKVLDAEREERRADKAEINARLDRLIDGLRERGE